MSNTFLKDQLDNTKDEYERSLMNEPGRNVNLNDNTFAYVTNKNILKKYQNKEQDKGLFCPSYTNSPALDYSILDVRNGDAYLNGEVLREGEEMKNSQSCYETDINVHVIQRNDSFGLKQGGRRCIPEMNFDYTMSSEINNPEECVTMARNNNHKYLGIQEKDTKLFCYTGNEIDQSIASAKITPIHTILTCNKEKDKSEYSFGFGENNFIIYGGNEDCQAEKVFSKQYKVDRKLKRRPMFKKRKLIKDDEYEYIVIITDNVVIIKRVYKDGKVNIRQFKLIMPGMPIDETNWNGFPTKNEIHQNDKIPFGTFLISNNNKYFITLVEDNNKMKLIVGCFQTTCNNPGTNNIMNYGFDNDKGSILTAEFADKNDNLINKVGYIDENMKLRLYPDNLITHTNEYIKKKNSGSPSEYVNDINKKEQCETLCNKDNECKGFVINPEVSKCWLQKQSMYTNTLFHKTENTLFVKQPKIMNECANKKMRDIDIYHASELLKGEDMNNDSRCNTINQEEIEKLKEATQWQIALNNNHITNIHEFEKKNVKTYNDNLQIYDDLKSDVDEYNNSLDKVKYNNVSIKAMEDVSEIERNQKKYYLIMISLFVITSAIVLIKIKK